MLKQSNKTKNDQTRELCRKTEKRASLVTLIILAFGAIVAADNYISITGKDRKPIDKEPCPLPSDSYVNSCANIASVPSSTDENFCNFTATCSTGAGLKYGPHAKTKYKFGQYGDKCPNVPMVATQMLLPKGAHFQFKNVRGQLTNERNRQESVERHITFVNDANCTLRIQLNAADTTTTSVAASAIAAVATCKLAMG
jgi:hypothetical protein